MILLSLIRLFTLAWAVANPSDDHSFSRQANRERATVYLFAKHQNSGGRSAEDCLWTLKIVDPDTHILKLGVRDLDVQIVDLDATF